MRRTVLLGLMWFVGGALPVALAVAAVGRVGNEVTGSRPSPLSAEEVARELAATTSTTAPIGDPTTTSPTTDTTAGSSPTTAPPATVTTVAPPTPTTAAAGETRTYTLVGGTATLRFEPTGVTVLAATPNPGFSVHAEPEHVNGVKVEFESEGHESQVTGWWEGGPRDEVREESGD